jgi:hypothetical protein
MAKRARTIPMAPSLKGTDQSGPAYSQPDLTMPFSLNLVTKPALGGRKRMGKRDGMARVFENPVGNGAPITGLGASVRAGQDVDQSRGTYQPFVDAFTSYNFQEPRYQGFLLANELLGNWIRLSKKPAEHGVNGWQGEATLTTGNTLGWIGAVSGNGIPNHLQLRSTFADGYDIGGTIGFDTSNDLTLHFDCFRRAAAVDLVDCHNVGPFIRGHPACGYFVWAYLARVAQNQVRLTIASMLGATGSTLAQSAILPVSGRDQRSSNMNIRLQATSVSLEATLEWADEPDITGTTIGVSSTLGHITQWVSFTGAAGTFVLGEEVVQATTLAKGRVIQRVQSGAAGFLQLYVTEKTFSQASTYGLTGAGGATASTAKVSTTWENRRAGVWFANPGTSYPGSEDGYYRRVIRATTGKRVVAEPELVAETFGTSKLQGGARYQLMPNWASYRINGNTSDANVITAGTNGYSSATAPDAPIIDTVDKVILGNATSAPVTDILTIHLWATTTPPGEHLTVRSRLRDITTTEDCRIGMAFCLSNLPT